MSNCTVASSDCSRPANNHVRVNTADLYTPNARFTPERQGCQVLTLFGKLGYSHILDMASGIDCPEGYDDPDSCFWRFYDAFGWPVTERVRDKPMETLKTMEKLRPAGEVFDYTSVNTEVLNWLIVSVSGERFADFVEREIWQRTGAESDALITSTSNGDVLRWRGQYYPS